MSDAFKSFSVAKRERRRCAITDLLMTGTVELTQWLKITEKVSFNIASEASYVYICNEAVDSSSKL